MAQRSDIRVTIEPMSSAWVYSSHASTKIIIESFLQPSTALSKHFSCHKGISVHETALQ